MAQAVAEDLRVVEDRDAAVVEAGEVEVALVLLERPAGRGRRARVGHVEALLGEDLGGVEPVPAAAPVRDEHRALDRRSGWRSPSTRPRPRRRAAPTGASAPAAQGGTYGRAPVASTTVPAASASSAVARSPAAGPRRRARAAARPSPASGARARGGRARGRRAGAGRRSPRPARSGSRRRPTPPPPAPRRRRRGRRRSRARRAPARATGRGRVRSRPVRGFTTQPIGTPAW